MLVSVYSVSFMMPLYHWSTTNKCCISPLIPYFRAGLFFLSWSSVFAVLLQMLSCYCTAHEPWYKVLILLILVLHCIQYSPLHTPGDYRHHLWYRGQLATQYMHLKLLFCIPERNWKSLWLALWPSFRAIVFFLLYFRAGVFFLLDFRAGIFFLSCSAMFTVLLWMAVLFLQCIYVPFDSMSSSTTNIYHIFCSLSSPSVSDRLSPYHISG